MENPEQFPELPEAEEGLRETEGWKSESIEIDETEDEKLTKQDPNEIGLKWYDSEIRYSLIGKINDELNAKVYLKLVEL